MKDLESIKHTLQHPDWSIRNDAIKDCGKIKSKESVKVIETIIKDKSPASWWRSLLGDPYFQVGFIRRNAWKALKDQDLTDFPLNELALETLTDPYYEARAECLNIIADEIKNAEFIPNLILKNTIREALWKETNIDICLALFPLCRFMLDKDETLLLGNKVLNYKNWRLRSAFLNCLIDIAEQSDRYHQEIIKVLKNGNMMSEYFRPIFQLKLKQSELVEIMQK